MKRTPLSVPARLFEAGKQDALASPSPTSKERKKLRSNQALYRPDEADRPEGLKDFIWIFAISTVVKILLMPSYRSTDFEVHRNWLAITHSLPMRDWYFEATSEWTLDYPPLFAYFEWGLSQLARFADVDMLVIDNLGHSSTATVVFQRLTVIAGDLVLLLGILMWSKTWSSMRLTECAHSRGKVAVIGGLTFFNPGLLFVDHIHFQYNGLLLGLLLISVALVRMRRNLMALSVFCLLLLMKHIFFYVVPVFGVYLLGHYCWSVVAAGQLASGLEKRCVCCVCCCACCVKCSRSDTSSDDDGVADDDVEDIDDDGDDEADDEDEDDDGGYNKRRQPRKRRTLSEDIQMHVIPGHFKPLHFLALVLIALFALFVTFGPIIASDVQAEWMKHGQINATIVARSSQRQMTQIFSRLFPWGRGLCHAYWAPNVWSWYVTGDRIARRAVKVLKIPFFQNMTSTAGMTGGLVQVTSMAVLPNIQPVVTFALTFMCILPVLWKVRCVNKRL